MKNMEPKMPQPPSLEFSLIKVQPLLSVALSSFPFSSSLFLFPFSPHVSVFAVKKKISRHITGGVIKHYIMQWHRLFCLLQK